MQCDRGAIAHRLPTPGVGAARIRLRRGDEGSQTRALARIQEFGQPLFQRGIRVTVAPAAEQLARRRAGLGGVALGGELTHAFDQREHTTNVARGHRLAIAEGSHEAVEGIGVEALKRGAAPGTELSKRVPHITVHRRRLITQWPDRARRRGRGLRPRQYVVLKDLFERVLDREFGRTGKQRSHGERSQK